eukprot:2135611-Ditylum_brightwellii.AAC.1
MEVDDDWDNDVQWEGETDKAGLSDSAVLVQGPNNYILPQRTFINIMAKQIGRRGQIILDLSFPVYRTQGKAKKRWKQLVLQASVNSTTKTLAPEEAVKDTGK